MFADTEPARMTQYHYDLIVGWLLEGTKEVHDTTMTDILLPYLPLQEQSYYIPTFEEVPVNRDII